MKVGTVHQFRCYCCYLVEFYENLIVWVSAEGWNDLCTVVLIQLSCLFGK